MGPPALVNVPVTVLYPAVALRGLGGRGCGQASLLLSSSIPTRLSGLWKSCRVSEQILGKRCCRGRGAEDRGAVVGGGLRTATGPPPPAALVATWLALGAVQATCSPAGREESGGDPPPIDPLGSSLRGQGRRLLLLDMARFPALLGVEGGKKGGSGRLFPKGLPLPERSPSGGSTWAGGPSPRCGCWGPAGRRACCAPTSHALLHL